MSSKKIKFKLLEVNVNGYDKYNWRLRDSLVGFVSENISKY